MMNCSDVSRLLDEREFPELTTLEHAELKAHVSGCADCAGQCLASERLASFRSAVPPLPASLRERARQLDELCESSLRPRSTRRPVIIGGLLLLGAATTMLTAVPWRDPSTARQ